MSEQVTDNKNKHEFIITTFYKFVELDNVHDLQVKLIKCFADHNLKGTILLAGEGLNGTIAGSRKGIDNFYKFVQSYPEIQDLEFKESICDYSPFRKVKIKIKSQIVKFNKPLYRYNHAGERIDSLKWEELVTRENVMLVDTRNDYEVAFGTFKNAVNPRTRNFTELTTWLDRNLEGKDKEQPIAMFCTGGVRCEKSTAYVKAKGFKNVYHLNGGILQYLSDTHNENGLWEGKCFVFDDRVILDSQLKPLA